VKKTTALLAAGLLAAGMTLSTGISAAATPSSSPWSQTDGTAGRARVNLTETTLSTSSVKTINRLRNLATPTATDNCDSGIPRSPVLAGGSVYDISTGWVSAYLASSGHLRWHHDLDPADDLSNETFLTSLAVAGGNVIVGGDECDSNSDPNGFLFAYNATTGAPVWTSSGSFGALDNFVVAGNEVVATGSSLGSGKVVTAYNLSTGVADWTQQGDSSCDDSPVLVVRSVVVTPLCSFTDGTSTLAAFDLSSGNPVWHRDGDWTVLGASDHSTNGHLYAQPSGGAITDLNGVTGATRFTLPGATRLLAVDNTMVYAGCGAGAVCGYNEASGAKVWQIADSSTLAAEANGVLYLADGKLLTSSTGTLIRRLWNPAATSLAVGDGRLAVMKPVAGTTPSMQLFGLPGE
jgi:hypothetical protein